jgi:hypothetical protein
MPGQNHMALQLTQRATAIPLLIFNGTRDRFRIAHYSAGDCDRFSRGDLRVGVALIGSNSYTHIRRPLSDKPEIGPSVTALSGFPAPSRSEAVRYEPVLSCPRIDAKRLGVDTAVPEFREAGTMGLFVLSCRRTNWRPAEEPGTRRGVRRQSQIPGRLPWS